MNVIFLDVDGVLNNHQFLARAAENSEGLYVDVSKAILLKQIVDKTAAKIVLSSSWKTMFDEQLKPTTDLASGLVDILEKHNLMLWDKTKSLKQTKANEIRHWLAVNENVESFVILDDDAYPDWNELTPRWIKTSYYIGLTQEHVDLAIRLLKQDGDSE